MSDPEIELIKCFLDEARELLAESEALFLELEQSKNHDPVIKKLFRVAHTLKGSAAAVGFKDFSKFAHKLESLLTVIRDEQQVMTSPIVELLLQSNDRMMAYLKTLHENPSGFLDTSDLQERMDSYLRGPLTPGTPTIPAPTSNVTIDAGFGFFDEPQSPPPLAVRTPEIPAPRVDASVRVNLERIDKLVCFVGELSTYQAVITQFRKEIPSSVFQSTIDELNKIGKNIQDLTLRLRMVPMKPTFQKMKRIVRDSAVALGKEADLRIVGEDVEVDKTILEQLDSPLMHLVRNAVDHGLEPTNERGQHNKSPTGIITLSAFHEAGHLVVEISDDGQGMDPEKLRRKAREKGLIRPDAMLSDKEALDLIFQSGFSTKPEVTDLSGRGVGMDVVKTNIERLNGTIALSTKVGEGSTFKITLPLTLSIIHGMVMRSAGQRYVVALSQVNRMLQLSATKITTLSGVGEVFVLDDKTIPLIRLDRTLITGGASGSAGKGVIVVLAIEGATFGLFVDDVLGQQSIVIRKLGDELAGAKGYAGGAILGDGKPALILDIKSIYEIHKANQGRFNFTLERKVA